MDIEEDESLKPKTISKVPCKAELLRKYNTATVTVDEAAGYIGVSIPTMRRYYSTGMIPSIRPGGKYGLVLFRIKTLDKWLGELEESSYKPLQMIPDELDYIV